MVRAPYAPSHERLARADGLYDHPGHRLELARAERGKGSAIFVHVWRGPPQTDRRVPCLSEDHLRWILARWTPRSRISPQTLVAMKGRP
jgi:L,D-peptidoglycan transpeptidase YkuD (ErfK/YbiS/YcfS/YnhG family)